VGLGTHLALRKRVLSFFSFGGVIASPGGILPGNRRRHEVRFSRRHVRTRFRDKQPGVFCARDHALDAVFVMRKRCARPVIFRPPLYHTGGTRASAAVYSASFPSAAGDRRPGPGQLGARRNRGNHIRAGADRGYLHDRRRQRDPPRGYRQIMNGHRFGMLLFNIYVANLLIVFYTVRPSSAAWAMAAKLSSASVVPAAFLAAQK
jgi:hypothetical protein